MLRGIETLELSLANELIKQQYEVVLLTAKRTMNPLVTPDPRIRVHELPVPRYYAKFFIAPQYAWDLIRSRYDAVIVFFADYGEATAWRLAKPWIRSKTQLIVYLCFANSAVPHRYTSLERAGFFAEAQQILTVSQYIADNAGPVVKRAIRVVPNGTDPNRFVRDATQRLKIRQHYGYDDQNIVLLNVSALEERKGIRRVIQVLPELLKTTPQLRYLILGKGTDESYLRQMIAERGLEQIVTFAGTTSDLPSYYSAADIFVLLADFDANSIVSYEALSCSLPIVVTSTGSYGETMRPEFSRLVNPAQAAEIVSAIAELCLAPDKREQMGRAGRDYVVKHLSWAASAARLAEYLENPPAPNV
jgi:glycosyltransferase involved in cell wall biosynthesis